MQPGKYISGLIIIITFLVVIPNDCIATDIDDTVENSAVSEAGPDKLTDTNTTEKNATEDSATEDSAVIKGATDADAGSVCDEASSESDSWYDTTHTYLSIQFCEPAVWFDSFFSDERIDEEFRPGTRVRWQHDFIKSEFKKLEYVTNINISFHLPKAKKSVNLFFEGEEEDSLGDVVPDNKREVRGDLGVHYEIRESSRANLSLRIKLTPSIKLRYRYNYPVSETFSTRFTQELLRKKSTNSATTRIDFEKKLSPDLFLRQTDAVTVSEDFDGKEWSASLVLFQNLSDVSALSYESAVLGYTEPENFTTNVRVGIRYRRNFFRKWLFYELAPALNWPRPSISDERRQEWEMLFRLEINFINL